MTIIMASDISSSWHETSQKQSQSKSRHASRDRRAKPATENIIHNRQRNPRGESSQHVQRSSPQMMDREAQNLITENVVSRYVSSKRDDVTAPLSWTEFANIIAESGRDLSTKFRLCRSCQSIIGWFLLNLCTWQRVTAGGDRYVSIQVLSEAHLVDTCLLCRLLGNLIQRLIAFDIGDRDRGYQISATTTEWLFKGSKAAHKDDDVPVFCVWPYGQPLLGPEIIRYNASFALSHASPDFYALSHPWDGAYVREIGPYADPKLIRNWIAFCDAQHQLINCHGPGDVSIPYFCVIDCNASPPCLVYADPRNSRGYITLSYVWGKDPCEGPDEYGRLPRRLPELIRGAIWVTLTLGYQYLWIDRYCVPQNDPIRKHSLIENMDKIYEGSALCIIAASAQSPTDGLHGINKPRELRQGTIHLGSRSSSQIMTNIKEEVDHSHWNSRGWTYQESILPKRRLVFTASQCCFQCGEDWFLETLGYPKQTKFEFSSIPQPFTDRHDQNHRLQEFDLRAKEYSRRQLSKDSDAVPAITGILNRFRYFTHVSGVPVFHPAHSDTPLIEALLEGLTWTFGVNYSVVESYSWETFPRRRLEVPSWTWCAWECRATRYEPSWVSSCTSSGGMEIFARTSIAVEDTEGRIAQWSGRTMKCMAKKLSTLSEVRFLRVCGRVCDVALPDGLQQYPPQIMSNRHDSIRYVDFGADVTRLQALARTRRIPRVDGHFMFLGWIVSIMDRPGSKNCETWRIMLLSTAANGQDVERFDMCLIRFNTLRPLSPGTVFLSGRGPRGWSRHNFRIS